MGVGAGEKIKTLAEVGWNEKTGNKVTNGNQRVRRDKEQGNPNELK